MEHNIECVKDVDYLPLPLQKTYGDGLQYISPCENCPKFGDTRVCKFEYPRDLRHKETRKVNIDAKLFFCFRKDVESFVQDFRDSDDYIPPYIDPKNEFYSQDLDLMIQAWHAIFERKEYLNVKSCKISAQKFFEEKNPQIGSTKSLTLGSLINNCFKGSWKEFYEKNKKA